MGREEPARTLRAFVIRRSTRSPSGQSPPDRVSSDDPQPTHSGARLARNSLDSQPNEALGELSALRKM